MDKNVLLYSGGLDSYVMFRIFEYDEILFFRLGNEDNERELEYIKGHPVLGPKVKIIDLPLSPFELENKIVPYRNHIMVMLASNFGNHIHCGFTAGDTTKDKDYVFKAQVEGIMNYFSIDKHKVAHSGYPYQIHMPFKDMTKKQIVSTFISNCGKENVSELWELSRSCYSGGEKECGVCRSCLRKYVAIYLNGIDCWDKFETDPRTGLEAFMLECKEKGRGTEYYEAREVMYAIRES